MHTIAPSATGIVDAQFSPDDSELAISSMDSLIRIVDLASSMCFLIKSKQALLSVLLCLLGSSLILMKAW